MEEYWDCTLKALLWPGNNGPTIIVDDGGDATMMILEGIKAEKLYESDKILPEPEKFTCEDEIYLMKLIRTCILKDSKMFRNMAKDLKGVSEETTTGVHRLY